MITPDQAREWLARARPEAKPVKAAIEAYATDMREGRWLLNGFPIILGKDPEGIEVLLDGYQRLTACCAADTPFSSVVVVDADPGILPSLDQHRRRAFAGVLQARGIPNAAAVETLVRKMIDIADGHIEKRFSVGSRAVSWRRLEAVIDANPLLHAAIDRSLPDRSKSILNEAVRSPIVFMALQTETAQIEDPPKPADVERLRALDHFLQGIASVMDSGWAKGGLAKQLTIAQTYRFFNPASRTFEYQEIDDRDPGVVFGRQLVQDRAKAGRFRLPVITVLAMAIKAYNATLEGDRRTFFAWTSKQAQGGRKLGEDFPKMVGYPGLKEPPPKPIAIERQQDLDLDNEDARTLAGVTIERVTVTPEKAFEWLTTVNPNNRSIVRAHVDGLARDIRNGKWLLNFQPICFDRDGLLLNGQHRLSAVHRAQTPVEFLIIRGLERNTFATFDRHARKPIAIGDILDPENKAQAALIKAAGQMCWKRYRTDESVEAKRTPPTADELRAYIIKLDSYPVPKDAAEGSEPQRGRFTRHVAFATAAGNLGTKVAMMVVAYRIFETDSGVGREIHETIATEFLEKLLTGANLEHNDPIRRLRDRLLRERGIRGRIAERHSVIDVIMPVWERFLRDRQRVARREPLETDRPGSAEEQARSL